LAISSNAACRCVRDNLRDTIILSYSPLFPCQSTTFPILLHYTRLIGLPLF